MNDMSIILFASIMMLVNVVLAIALLVQEHNRRYKPQRWIYIPQDKPYDWEYEKFVDMVNAEYQQAS
jgi:hypothetical protein